MSSGGSSGGSSAAADACAYQSVSNYDRSLNIGAVFVILTASVLGTSIPLLAKRYPSLARYPFIFVVGKHIGTGVLLALGFIHLLAPAFDELGNPCLPPAWSVDYEYAPLFCLLAALAMHFIETVAHQYMDQGHSSHSHSAGDLAYDQDSNHRSSRPAGLPKRPKSLDDSDSVTEVEMMEAGGVDKPPHTPPAPSSTLHAPDAAQDIVSYGAVVEQGGVEAAGKDPLRKAHSHGQDHSGHMHSVLLADVDKTVAAYILEFGLTTHSVIIGITVGVASRSDLNTLLPALCFHQFFEGMALGARLADVGFSVLNEVQLMLIYSLSCPIGIAIGCGITTSYNQNSNTANLVEGTFDAVSAGIILYVAFVQMLAVEFTKDYNANKGNWQKQLALWAGMYFGAGVMAFIGKVSYPTHTPHSSHAAGADCSWISVRTTSASPTSPTPFPCPSSFACASACAVPVRSAARCSEAESRSQGRVAFSRKLWAS